MADGVDVKMTGIETLRENVSRIIKTTPTATMKGVKRIAFKIETQAKLNITALGAVDTGRLRASISTNWTGSGISRGKVDSKAKAEDGVGPPQTKKDVFSATTGTNVEYGRRIEHGFVGPDKLGRQYNQAPRQYLYPAFFSLKDDLPDEIASEWGKEIAKSIKRGTK